MPHDWDERFEEMRIMNGVTIRDSFGRDKGAGENQNTIKALSDYVKMDSITFRYRVWYNGTTIFTDS